MQRSNVVYRTRHRVPTNDDNYYNIILLRPLRSVIVFTRRQTHIHVHVYTHTHGRTRDGLLLLVVRGPFYPVRLNSILKKPIISDKSALGFIINEIIHAHTHTHSIAPDARTLVTCDGGDLYQSTPTKIHRHPLKYYYYYYSEQGVHRALRLCLLHFFPIRNSELLQSPKTSARSKFWF